MTQKYFIGKCGGEDCMFRTGVILGEHQCLKDIEKCSKERCQNCPHGKTIEEMAQKLEDNKDFRAIIDDKDVSYAEIAEVMIKALLGGGGKLSNVDFFI